MTATQTRLQQAIARQELEQRAQEATRAHLGNQLRAQLRREAEAYQALCLRYGGTPPMFVTGPELRADALWAFGLVEGLLSHADRPAWIRERGHRCQD